MTTLSRANRRHIRHLVTFVAVVAPALYFAPIPTAILLACGAADISRHRKITFGLVEEYFTGKGLLTWLLSPFNLCADLLALRIPTPTQLGDLPEDCRQEIDACVAAFVANGGAIKTAIAPHIAQGKRVMLTFKWFSRTLNPELEIPAFQQKFNYVKTIAVSAFSGREQTSWHFGPQRLTLRVLRNLEPFDSPDVYVAVDDQVHRWNAEPLLIFDDTRFHRSVNNIDEARYCLFVDIVRPSHFKPGFDAAIGTMSAFAGAFRSLFYKNWAFVR